MESVRFTTEDRDGGQGTIADVTDVQDKVAKLFDQFRLDLEKMFGRSVQRGTLHEVTHLPRRTRVR